MLTCRYGGVISNRASRRLVHISSTVNSGQKSRLLHNRGWHLLDNRRGNSLHNGDWLAMLRLGNGHWILLVLRGVSLLRLVSNCSLKGWKAGKRTTVVTGTVVGCS